MKKRCLFCHTVFDEELIEDKTCPFCNVEGGPFLDPELDVMLPINWLELRLLFFFASQYVSSCGSKAAASVLGKLAENASTFRPPTAQPRESPNSAALDPLRQPRVCPFAVVSRSGKLVPITEIKDD